MTLQYTEEKFEFSGCRLCCKLHLPEHYMEKKSLPLLFVFNNGCEFDIPDGETPVIFSFLFDKEMFPEQKFEKTPSVPVKALLELLDSVLKKYPVDFERLYLMGNGTGTCICWELLRRRPGLFAGAILIGGGTDPEGFVPNAATAFRLFHSADDKEYPVDVARNIFLMLMDAYCDVKLKEFSGTESVRDILVNENAFSWLFGVRQKIFTSMPLPEKMNVVELDSCGFTAAVLPEAGGNIFSLRHKESGIPLLREPHRPEELFHTPERFGIPVLFPPNRIEDGSFFFEGKICRLPVNQKLQNLHLHGLAVSKPWKLTAAGKDFAEVKFVFDEHAPEYEGFPFAFEIVRRYELNEKGLQDTVTVRNKGKSVMPLGLGFHTAFPAKQVKVRVGTGDCEIEIDKKSFLPTGQCIKWNGYDPRGLFDPFGRNVGFHAESGNLPVEKGLQFHGAELVYPEGILRYITDEKFGFWYTWNAGGLNDFLCLEPVSWMANALNLPLPAKKSGVRKLDAGAEITFISKLEFSLLPHV
ncbi:MAG: hypothetical protein IKB25_10065 [Lentisphaeria bacterium]|nr:hypothetical protein [Lentisphaeria bacterium]